jgi:hypothetical protein
MSFAETRCDFPRRLRLDPGDTLMRLGLSWCGIVSAEVILTHVAEVKVTHLGEDGGGAFIGPRAVPSATAVSSSAGRSDGELKGVEGNPSVSRVSCVMASAKSSAKSGDSGGFVGIRILWISGSC